MLRIIRKFSKSLLTRQSVKKISNYTTNKKSHLILQKFISPEFISPKFIIKRYICTNKNWLPYEIIINRSNGVIDASGKVVVEPLNDSVTISQNANLEDLKNLLTTIIDDEIEKFRNDSIYNYTINALKSHLINNINVELHNSNLNISKAEINFDSLKGDSIKINYDTSKLATVDGDERYELSMSHRVYFRFDEQNESEIEKFKLLLNTTIYNEIAELRRLHEKDNITINDLKNKIMKNVNMIVSNLGLYITRIEILRR